MPRPRHEFDRDDLEIARLLAEGAKDAEIADAVRLPVATVKTRVRQLLFASESRNRADFAGRY